MKKIIFFCLSIALASCGQNAAEPAPAATVSATIKKAVELAGTAVGGQTAGSLSADGKTFDINISNSAVMGQEPDLVSLHASRSAWVFYQNIGSEKPGFETINVHSQLKDTTATVSFTISQLETVKTRMPAVQAVADLLIKGDYTALHALFDQTVMGPSQVGDLQAYCTSVEPDYGKPLSFEFKGFAFNKTSGGQDFLSLAGQLKRQQKDTPLAIAIDLAKPDMKGSLNSIKFDY